MSLRSERDIIIEQAMQSPERLETALKIGEAYPHLCARVIVDFLAKLESRIRKTDWGQHWKISRCASADKLQDKWLELIALRRTYSVGEIGILVVGDELNLPKHPWIGVRADDAKDRHENLRKTLNKEVGAGMKGDPTVWYKYIYRLRPEFGNWGSVETTLLMSQDDDFCTRMAEMIESVAITLDNTLTGVPNANTPSEPEA